MTLAPILLFTYNRPQHTHQTLNALLENKLCQESELFVFSDGFKGEEDKKEVMEVRRIIYNIKGFRKYTSSSIVLTGTGQSIIDGVTK